MWKKNKYIKICLFKTCLALSQEQIWTLAEVICINQLKNYSFRMVLHFWFFRLKILQSLIKPKFNKVQCWNLSSFIKCFSKKEQLTLFLLGYLKTRIRWGGAIWPPTPLNPRFDVEIWQMLHHWKAHVLYF